MNYIDDIEDRNLRHLARMNRAVEQYKIGLINLQTLIGELEFLRDAITCLPSEDYIPLNNILMDMESYNSTFFEEEKSHSNINEFVKKLVDECNQWIKDAVHKIEKEH